MKALVFLGPGQMEYREEPDPVPGVGEVLVRVSATGICGSDMHGWHGVDPRRKPPLIMGHETAGWIESGPRRGERVVVNPLISCGACRSCLSGAPQLCARKRNLALPGLPGAFADLVRVPERNAIQIPDCMDFVTASVTEPVACSYHAVQLGARVLGRPVSGLRVLVIGAGAIGLAAGLVLRAQNAKSILVCATNETRCKIARAAGLTETFSPEESTLDPACVDLVIDSVGAAGTRAMASRVVRDGGAIVHVGLMPGSEGLDVRRLTLGEIMFTGSYCYSAVDFMDTIDLLARNELGPLTWVATRPMAEGRQAFEELAARTAAATKIVLRNEAAAAPG